MLESTLQARRAAMADAEARRKADIASSKGPGFREIAIEYGVKKSSLHARYTKKTKDRREAHEDEMILSLEQEQVLKDWAIYLPYAGLPWTYETLRLKVLEISNRLPSRKWVYRFLERHNDLRVSEGSGLDKKRAR